MVFFAGLLKQLCDILMASGVPADVLTEVSINYTQLYGECLILSKEYKEYVNNIRNEEMNNILYFFLDFKEEVSKLKQTIKDIFLGLYCFKWYWRWGHYCHNTHIVIYLFSSNWRGNISSRFFWNSEALALEFLENLEEMSPQYFIHYVFATIPHFAYDIDGAYSPKKCIHQI